MPTIAPEKFDKATADNLRFRSAGPAERLGEESAELDGILPSPPRPTPAKVPWENVSEKSTEQGQETAKAIDPLIRLPRERAPQRRFDVLQQWEGIVVEITRDAFWAQILDLTDHSKPSEIVELPLAEVPVADRPLLQAGQVFYWIIGYETSAGGQIRRVSEIRVRRAPEWSQYALDLLKAKARQLYEKLHGNGQDHSTTCQ